MSILINDLSPNGFNPVVLGSIPADGVGLTLEKLMKAKAILLEKLLSESGFRLLWEMTPSQACSLAAEFLDIQEAVGISLVTNIGKIGEILSFELNEILGIEIKTTNDESLAETCYLLAIGKLKGIDGLFTASEFPAYVVNICCK